MQADKLRSHFLLENPRIPTVYYHHQLSDLHHHHHHQPSDCCDVNGDQLTVQSCKANHNCIINENGAIIRKKYSLPNSLDCTPIRRATRAVAPSATATFSLPSNVSSQMKTYFSMTEPTLSDIGLNNGEQIKDRLDDNNVKITNSRRQLRSPTRIFSQSPAHYVDYLLASSSYSCLLHENEPYTALSSSLPSHLQRKPSCSSSSSSFVSDQYDMHGGVRGGQREEFQPDNLTALDGDDDENDDDEPVNEEQEEDDNGDEYECDDQFNKENKRHAGLWTMDLSAEMNLIDRGDHDDDLEVEKYLPKSCYAEIDEIEQQQDEQSEISSTSSNPTSNTNSTTSNDDQMMSEENFIRRQRPHNISVNELASSGVRKLWCEIPEVHQSGLLDCLSHQERQLQEALFEVITSEATYFRGLTILVNHFLNSKYFHRIDNYQATSSDCPGAVIAAERDELRAEIFSNIGEIYEVSKSLLSELENRWQQDLLITDLCDIIHKYASEKFRPYITYCRFQCKQENRLHQYLNEHQLQLRQLESASVCQGLTLHSFLLLPLQRVTRYPLLIEAIFNRQRACVSATNLEQDERNENFNCNFVSDENHEITKKTLTTLNKLVEDCNSAAKQYKDFVNLLPKLKFTNIPLQLQSSWRWMQLTSEVSRLKPEFQSTLIASISKTPYWSKSSGHHLFLLNDLILLSKRKKSDDNYLIYDYCYRSLVQVNRTIDYDGGDANQHQHGYMYKPPDCFKNCLIFTFLHNFCGKRAEYYFNFPSEKEKIKWLISIELLAEEDEQTSSIDVLFSKETREIVISRADRLSKLSSCISDTGYESEGIPECTDEIFI